MPPTPPTPRPSSRIHAAPIAALAVALLLLAPAAASAHVKWFCAYDVAGQPVGLDNVLCPDFELLVAASALGLLLGTMVERTPAGSLALRLLDRSTGALHRNADLMLRATIGFFLVSLWNLGDVILTPELKTANGYVPWLQLAMAASLVHRRTMWLCGFGIAALYADAIADYGVFHMMDYPIFLGIAAYLVIEGVPLRSPLPAATIVRWATGVTLLWASIEKWAYPDWTSPLFITHPRLAMGFDPDFFMRAAGAVEFALAFGLFLGPLVRRASASLLLFIFISAIPEFGRVDAIGHSGIIAVLLAVIAEATPAPALARSWLPSWRPLAFVPAAYAAVLVLTLAAYYEFHHALYGTTVM